MYLAEHNNKLTTTEQIIDGFADYFQSFFKENDGKPTDFDFIHLKNSSSAIDPITESEIFQAAKELSNSQSTGYDRIPNFIAKDLVRIFAMPLMSIYNNPLTTFTFPRIWKTAKVTPIFKSGDKAKVENYRPVSLIPVFTKIFEKIMYRILSTILQSKLSNNQHGFMKGRSTVSNLVIKAEYIAEGLETGDQVDVIYLDIRRAFDSVNHNIIIQKLSKFGLSVQLLKLIKSYLSDRQQFVCYSGSVSRKYAVRSGVPQGSVLGPLLFICFINDLSAQLETRHLMYADDLKIFMKIRITSDQAFLQM